MESDHSSPAISLLPKVELHLHLDCSLSYHALHLLDPQITRDQYHRQFMAPAKCSGLMELITPVFQSLKYMQTAEQLEVVVLDLFEQLKKDKVFYAEIRFAPLLHTEKGLTPGEAVSIVEQATASAIKHYGIHARLILCTLRHFTEAQSMETVELVQTFKNSHVTGFDLAADEAGYPVDQHRKAYDYAHQTGIPCTCHAGEARGADSVWECLRELRPSRIGHGVRSIEDPALIQYLRDQHIHLEICPSSNVQMNLVETYGEHPVDKLYRLGVSLGINTDNRTLSDITLTREYEKLQSHFSWGIRHFLDCNLHAIRAAFIPEPLKQELAERIMAEYKSMNV
ncbi:MAG TPA: adenosine deaminase [Saprospiraceae bacterium]|nr:adenosine deaminase [Saprospiraceae bacterium]HNT20624.1 adenosine deaminase [Saprospiraceae bacterium]